MSVPPISALDARSTQSALDDLLSLGVGELVTGDSDQPSSSNFRKDMETSGIVVVPGIPLDGNTSSSTPQDAQTSDDLFSLQVGELGPLLNGGGRDTKSKADFTHIQEDVNPRDHWNIIGELVDGAFGKVEKAVSRTDPMLYAASESIELQEGEELENFSVGIKIMSECTGHPVMMGLYSTYFFDNKLTMLLEFCGGGAVDNILVKLRHSLQEDQIRFIGYYVCDALKWLHSQNVIHRDLKAGNVLLTIDGQVRLAGFRVSAKLKSEREKRGTIIGTPHWMAPEVMACETFKDQPYDCISDIWSFGITLIEMARGEPPHIDVSAMKVIVKVQKSDPPLLRQPSNWTRLFSELLSK